MRSQIPVLIFNLGFLSTFHVIAQEGPNRDLQQKSEIVVGLSEWDLIEASAPIRILQLFEVSDGKDSIDDKSLEKLERFPELRTLVIGCPQMTDKGLKHIAKLKHLECLIIYQCEITDSGIQDLKSLSKLQVVGFHDTAVTDKGIAKMKVIFPKTYIELGSTGKNGQIFDANGCMRPQFLKRHLTIQQSVAK